jgi:hypothetical protein
MFRGTEAAKIGYTGNDVAPDELASYLPVRPDSRQQSAIQLAADRLYTDHVGRAGHA